MTSASEFSVGLTHIFRGTPRLTAARKKTSQAKSALARSDCDRRLQLIEELYRLHTRQMRDALAGAWEIGTLPRDEWLNDQLARLGETWRVQNVDGFRYEIYDVG